MPPNQIFKNFRTNWTNFRTLSEFQDISGHFLKCQEFQDRVQACVTTAEFWYSGTRQVVKNYPGTRGNPSKDTDQNTCISERSLT